MPQIHIVCIQFQKLHVIVSDDTLFDGLIGFGCSLIMPKEVVSLA